MEKQKLKISGEFVLEKRDKFGNVLQREVVKNTIVNTGLQRAAELLCGDSTTGFDYIAIGSGVSGDAVLVTDTALETEITREQADDSGSRYEADYKAVFEHIFVFYSAEAYTVREVGVFDGAVILGSVMLDRIVCNDISVDASNDLYVKVTITFSV